MDELISRRQAIEAILHRTNCKTVRELFEYNVEHNLTDMWSGGINDAIDAVIAVPPAEPEVTHCAECIHWKHSTARKSYCEVFDWMSKAEDFCSYAERREE